MGKSRTYGAAVVEFWGESIAITAARIAYGIPPGVEEVMFNGSAIFRLQLAPAIVFCGKTDDAAVTFTDYTSEAKDRDTATSVVLSSLNTAANDNYWYLASHYKFGGATLDVDAANGTTSAMTGYYWNGSTWADASITDGTDSGGACLAVDGALTWTVPSAWEETTLNGITGLFVMRFQVSVALDSSTTVDEIALHSHIGTANDGFFAAATDYIQTVDQDKVGALNVITNTVTLKVTYMRHAKTM